MTRVPADSVAVEVQRVALIDGPDGLRAAEAAVAACELAAGERVSAICWGVYARRADGTACWLHDAPGLSEAMARAMVLAGPLPVRGPMTTGRASA